MNLKKKIQNEYLILGIAWLFWGISNALIWYQDAKNPDLLRIVSTTSLQTLMCISINVILLQCIIAVQKRVISLTRHLILSAVLIIVFSILLVFINISIHYYFKDTDKIIQSLPTYLINATEKIVYLTGFCAMFFFIRHLKEYQIQKSIAEEAQQAARDAQLQMLQQQLNPHFLFNTLNSLRSLIAIDTDRARTMVTDLSEFLRITLSSYKSIHNTLKDEINLLEYYLKIQKVRFEDDIEYSFDIDAGLFQFTVPKYILQPLVENAVKFGMQTSPMPLRITISAYNENDKVVIAVQNTGSFAASNTDTHCNNGIDNTKTRLELMFPDQSEFVLLEKDGIVRAEITINTVRK